MFIFKEHYCCTMKLLCSWNSVTLVKSLWRTLQNQNVGKTRVAGWNGHEKVILKSGSAFSGFFSFQNWLFFAPASGNWSRNCCSFVLCKDGQRQTENPPQISITFENFRYSAACFCSNKKLFFWFCRNLDKNIQNIRENFVHLFLSAFVFGLRQLK